MNGQLAMRWRRRATMTGLAAVAISMGALAMGPARAAPDAPLAADATQAPRTADAPPQVTVQLVQPTRFSDAGYSRALATPGELAQMRQAFEAALRPLAERRLKAGDQLDVEVLDVDLAGELEPLRSRGGGDLRVMREITWPPITLRYTLRHGGAVLRSGEQRLSDLDYLGGRSSTSSPARYEYEARLLRRWFEQSVAGTAGQTPAPQ